MGKIVGVISLKGGVGKTSSVVSLGAALASFGKKVLLVDANFSAPNLGLHLNVISPEKTIHHVLGGKENLTEAIVSLEDFDILPASLFPNFLIDPLKLKTKLRSLKQKYDIILLDSSPSLNSESLASILASDELLVVTTPDYSTLSLTLKTLKFSHLKGVPVSGLILNKVYGKNFELSLDEIERSSEVPVLAVIPHDPRILKAQANFIPFTNFKPRSSAGIEYSKLAALLIGEKIQEPRFRSFLDKFAPKRQEINRQIFYTSVFS
jgi:MinD-like ATPase involved in chromosome partitioning or flagellar assembly